MEKRRIGEIRGSVAKAECGMGEVQGNDRSRVRRLPRHGPSGHDKGNERRNRGVFGEGRAE